MHSTAFILLAASLSGFVSAQTGQNSSTTSQSTYPYLLNPNDPLFTTQMRQDACNAQRQSCPKLCPNGAFPNTCDTQTLTWVCQCTDGTTPNVTAFKTTLPFFECQQYIAECVANTNDAQAQLVCQNITCGSQGTPDDYASRLSMSMALTATSSASSTSATSAPASATPDSTAATPSPSTGAAPVFDMHSNMGTGALVAGIFGGFAFLL